MNKKGFTIIELIISVSILTIVMVFALNLLVVLKEQETSLDTDTDMILNQAFVSKKINGDIIKNGVEIPLSVINNLNAASEILSNNLL